MRGEGLGLPERTHLEEHSHGRDNNTLEHAPGLEQRLDGDELELESVPGGGLAQVREVLGDGALLEQRLGLDLEELELHELVVGREPAEAGEHAARLFLAALVDQPTRRERHEDHTHEQDHSRCQLQADRSQPRGIGLVVAPATDEVGTTERERRMSAIADFPELCSTLGTY